MFYLGLGHSRIRQKRSSISTVLPAIVVHQRNVRLITKVVIVDI